MSYRKNETTKRLSEWVCIIVLCGLPAAELHAQMVTERDMSNYAEAFGLSDKKGSQQFAVRQLEWSPRGNVLWPGDRTSITYLVNNQTDQPIEVEGRVDIVAYGTRGIPGNMWLPVVFKIDDIGSIPIKVDLAAHGNQKITIKPEIPERFGGYALVFDLGEHGRYVATMLVRVQKPDMGKVQYPTFQLDAGWPHEQSEELFAMFQRLGVKGVRFGAEPRLDKPENESRQRDFARRLKWLDQYDVTVMFTVGAGDLPQPLGMPRPHLDENNVMLDTKADHVWLPEYDDYFERWVMKTAAEFGWPKGPVNAMELWNEPWEGISISGWGADMLRYRELYKRMAKGIIAARQTAGVEVLIGGAGSSSNTIDKLFCDSRMTYLDMLDFASIHYQPLAATPSVVPHWVHRKSPYGPVRCWDTESWMANSDDRIAVVIASMRAQGQSRAGGVYHGNVYHLQHYQHEGENLHVVQAWSAAASVAAAQKFIGQRDFKELLFKSGLPWVMIFDGIVKGRNEDIDALPDDGTIVVVGDLSGLYDRDRTLFRSVLGLANRQKVQKLNEAAETGNMHSKDIDQEIRKASILTGGKMVIRDGDGRFTLYDFYGNRIDSRDGAITIPLNDLGYYLRTDGSRGSFAALVEEVRHARIEGYEPVEIIAHDMTARIEDEPDVRLTITNILNRPVQGNINVQLGELNLDQPVRELALAPHETRELSFTITGGRERADNTYPLSVLVDAGEDGRVPHQEQMHVNVISKRKIAVDGELEDWKNVVPQVVSVKGISPNITEKAWLPFVRMDDYAGVGNATAYLAYDERNFYFAARIVDSSPYEGNIRFESRDDDEYYYPDEVIERKYVIRSKYTIIDGQYLSTMANPDRTGQITREVWEHIPGVRVEDLTGSSDYPHHPGKSGVISLFESPPNIGEDYGTRIQGYLHPPVTGEYTFAISGDDNCELWLSTDQDPANAKRIASVPEWTDPMVWDKYPEQESQPIQLEADKRYFIRALHKEGGGADGLTVGWLGSGIESIEYPDPPKLKWPEDVRRFTYRKNPDLPAGIGTDNVQIAFNVLPPEQKPWLMHPPGTMYKFITYWCTDYEYALNTVAESDGGGTEIYRLLAPGMPRKHHYPRQPDSPIDGGPVKSATLVTLRDGNTRIVEAAIPWSELNMVKHRLDNGDNVKFSFRVNDNAGPSYELAAGRSVSKQNSGAFHNDWVTSWANELEFAFEQ